MFPSLSSLHNVPCPDEHACTRPSCIFSHTLGHYSLPELDIPLTQERPKPSTSTQPHTPPPVIPHKRPVPVSPPGPSSFSTTSTRPVEPPRKFQKVGLQSRAFPVASGATHTDTGVPIIRVNPALSHTPIPTRQAMVKTLYEHYVTLYGPLHKANPSLASEHALRQEDEVYQKSTKGTYRVAVIQCIASIKRREKPTSVSHISVGTSAEVQDKLEAKDSLESLQLSNELLEPLIHSKEELVKWGYIVDIPPGEGSREPSREGKVAKCERCTQPFQVKRMEEADECTFHWGKALMTRVAGEKTRVYTCCSRPAESEGCVHGPHVFYESGPEDLHARHGFSFLKPPDPSRKTLDVASMDCEMIYTTGGMRVARVSIVDGSGKEVFDEFIRMDDGVHVIDYNTRFSGVTRENHSKAPLDLAAVREVLNSLLSSETILLGHALDNDLKTMRMIHHRCVDTALLFPHRAGPPYRRSLRDLVKEKLGRIIQLGTGDITAGHSSLEDAVATLDLVRWQIINCSKPSASTPSTKPSTSSSTPA
ncbi:Rexo1 protein [Coprinellus micaceus]|uniref:Rexo1 protein n=1 Tax=Coprinellus micaceus TaxID=71717 RepID=A0A4Y7TNW5_COPMI|nr:Rexo1 protein [Coprinellus micaceus]